MFIMTWLHVQVSHPRGLPIYYRQPQIRLEIQNNASKRTQWYVFLRLLLNGGPFLLVLSGGAGRHLLYPRGLGLGGCSLINGMLYLRGQAEDYNVWAETVEDSSWRWEHMLPLYKGQEHYHGGEGPHHGWGGPWRVEKVRTNWEILGAFADAAEKYGVPRVTDFNTGNNFGVGLFDVNQANGRRLNAYQAFLPKQRSNLEVMSEVIVEKLLLDAQGEDCYGVEVVHLSTRDKTRVRVTGEVVMCAGAVGSVQVLERSGVGNGEVLDQAGVQLVRHLPGVGENLQDHLQIRTVFEVENVATLNTLANSLWGKAKIAAEYAMYRSGAMAAAPSQMGAFVPSSPDIDRPDLEFHVQPLSLAAFGQPLDSYNAFTASVCHLRPTSRGSIHITSGGDGCVFVCFVSLAVSVSVWALCLSASIPLCLPTCHVRPFLLKITAPLSCACPRH